MNVERLIGNCPKCKLSHCLFDKCDRYKTLYPHSELVDLTPFVKTARFCDREAIKLRSLSRPLSPDETKFLNAYDLYQNGLLGIVQLRAVAKKTIFKYCFSYGYTD